MAVLNLPVLFEKSEYQPVAVLATPVLRFFSALVPSAVVNPGYPPSGGGTTAFAFCRHGMNPKTSAIETAKYVEERCDKSRSEKELQLTVELSNRGACSQQLASSHLRART
jgi:hypothetical protein